MQEEEKEQAIQIEKFGEFDNGKFYTKQGGNRKIALHFKDFYINRVQYVG